MPNTTESLDQATKAEFSSSRSDLALQMYLDFTTEARHAEDQIPNLANVLILVVAGLLGIDSIVGDETSLLSYGFMILIGTLGLVSSNKFRQRKYHAIHRALEFREYLNIAEPGLDIDERIARARTKDRRKFPISNAFSTALVWGVFYLSIIAIGGWGVWQDFG
ncbi:MAG: hypothetical protein ABJH52_08985 [Henriciella sp.]